MAKEIILQRKILSADIAQKPFRIVNELVPHSNVIVETMLACEELIAIRTIQSDQLLFEDLLAVDFRLRFITFVLLLDLLQVIALDVTI